MLQSLAEKQSTYTQKWAIRRVVFEPTHRYLFYSEPLTHKVHEQLEVQDAIFACRDIHTVWKHKIKVTRVVRDVQLHKPMDEATLRSEGLDVRNLFILHVEGHRRRVRPEGLDKFASATHAAFDEASPHKTSKTQGIGRGFADAVEQECKADDDELSSFDQGALTSYTFRFLSQSVFTQWFEKITRQLELDGVTDTKYSVDCPKVDPRCQIPMARVPLHLLHSMHVLDQFVFYALVRGTRVLLDESKHRRLPLNADHHHKQQQSSDTAVSYDDAMLPDVHLDSTSTELHLLRYQQAADYDGPTYILVTDNVLYFVRMDGKVVWTLNLIDVEEVWYNTVAKPEPFVVFKNRAPLADLVFLVHAPSAASTSAGGSGGGWPSGYHDTTLYGHDGAVFLVQVLERLAPHAAALRARGEKAVMSAPAFRQKQQSTATNGNAAPTTVATAVGGENKSTATEPVAPFQCVGLNIFGSFEEYVREAANTIRWRVRSDLAPSVITGRAAALPHLQVSPTPRWKLLRALEARERQRTAQGTDEAEGEGAKGSGKQPSSEPQPSAKALAAAQSISIDDDAPPVAVVTVPTPPQVVAQKQTPLPATATGKVPSTQPENPARALHPQENSQPAGDPSTSTVPLEAKAAETTTTATVLQPQGKKLARRSPKPEPILLPPSSAAMLAGRHGDTTTLDDSTQTAALPQAQLATSPASTRLLSTLQKKPSNISAVMLSPEARPGGAASAHDGPPSSGQRQDGAGHQEAAPFNDLLGLFSPKLRPKGSTTGGGLNNSSSAPATSGHPQQQGAASIAVPHPDDDDILGGCDSILLEDSSLEIDEDDL